MTKDKRFMSCYGRAIWFGQDDDGNIFYMVARGDGTDEIFATWQEAMAYCKAHPRRKG